MTLATKRLIRDMAKRIPELAHVRPSRVLVVAGEARRASRATIRGTAQAGGGQTPILVHGRPILYVITLRPPWFLRSRPDQRVGTIIHELYHAATRFDGTLHRQRRHRELHQEAYGRRVRALLEAYLARAPAPVLAPFAFTGLAKVRMWLERPTWRSRRGARQVYTEKQLFHALLPMRAGAAARVRRSEPDGPPGNPAGRRRRRDAPGSE